MFPSVSSGQKSAKSAKHNSNRFKYVNYYLNSKTLWQDQYPPENIEKIYDNCSIQMQSIKSNLDSFRDEFRINDSCVIETLTRYSRHLTRLKTVVGLSEIKSAKTMADVVKIVKNNIEYTRREQKRAAELLAKSQNDDHHDELRHTSKSERVSVDAKPSMAEPSTEAHNEAKKRSDAFSIDDDEVFSDEEQNAVNNNDNNKEQTLKLDLTNTINFLQKRRARTVEPFESLKRSDSIITPILMKAKKERINVSPETEEDLEYLERLLESTLKAINLYTIEIDRVEKLCDIFEKYFLSFRSFVDCLLDDETTVKNRPSPCQYEYIEPEKPSYQKLLEPVIKYDEKRKEYNLFVRGALRNLKRLAETFTDGTHEGIFMRRHMSDDAHKLARRCDCELVQAALIIPEYSSQLNKCLSQLYQWLDYDRSYADCVRDELQIVEREKKRLSQMRNTAESTFNQINHKYLTAYYKFLILNFYKTGKLSYFKYHFISHKLC